jgi:hypothetical protein
LNDHEKVNSELDNRIDRIITDLKLR